MEAQSQTEEAAVQEVTQFKSRLHKKFQLKFSHLDLTYDKEQKQYVNEETRKVFEIFTLGWQSHPAFNVNRVSIIGEMTQLGEINLSQHPKLHISYYRAKQEVQRLESVYKKKFKIFTCMDDDNKLTEAALRQYKKNKKDKQASLITACVFCDQGIEHGNCASS